MSRPRTHKLVGRTFGTLRVVGHVDPMRWRVVCTCRSTKVMLTQVLLRAKSCGCQRISPALRAELERTKARLAWAERLLEAVCVSPSIPPAVRATVDKARTA